MARSSQVEKRLLQLVGEYAVAAQMALHGWHASPTVGNFPEVDLVAYKPATGKRVTVQVKTARKRGWPVGTFKWPPDEYSVEGIVERADVYVFVHLPEQGSRKAEFFVIEPKRLKELCEKVVEKTKPANAENPLPVGENWWRNTAPEAWEEFAQTQRPLGLAGRGGKVSECKSDAHKGGAVFEGCENSDGSRNE